jgi:hypothetical protein
MNFKHEIINSNSKNRFTTEMVDLKGGEEMRTEEMLRNGQQLIRQ